MDRSHRTLAGTLLLAALAAFAGGAGGGIGEPERAAGAAGQASGGRSRTEFETTSEFSHLLVKRQGSVRTLIFVRDNGDEVEESMVNVKKPYDMLVPYVRFMFTSYLFQPKPQRVLIVGLGGGAMVHFLRHYEPELTVDVVEIDPAVVSVADKYFDVRSGGKIDIITDDGRKYLETTDKRYDVIYLDAFLKPAAETDSTGMPLAMKTTKFYKGIQKKLTPEGLVVFNLNRQPATEADIRTIRGAFGQAYVFRMQTDNLVVAATLSKERLSPAEVRSRAKPIDARFKATFSFQELSRHLVP
jgi:spermidine synthase